MRLLTHNLMACLRCQTYPLDIEVAELALLDDPYDLELTTRLVARIDYAFLLKALADVAKSQGDKLKPLTDVLPPTEEQLDPTNDAQMRAVHRALSCVAVKTGHLACSKCTSKYPITDFIPNMMLDG